VGALRGVHAMFVKTYRFAGKRWAAKSLFKVAKRDGPLFLHRPKGIPAGQNGP